MTAPQDLVDAALAATRSRACTVILRRRSSANLRWANNTLTTNGVMASSRLTVVAQAPAGGGVAAGVVTGSAASLDDVLELVARADAAAADAAPADDANPLATGESSADWSDPPAETSIGVFETVASEFGETFGLARAQRRLLYGFVEHALETTYLGTSGGLRLRHVQPYGEVGITGKPEDRSTSAWVGMATDDFTDVDIGGLDAELARRIGWARRSMPMPAGRYETLLPPTAVADLMTYAYFVASGRDADEGRTVYSDPAGGTRIGRRIASPGVRLSSDPAHEGIGAIPFVATSATSSSTSVFDNGFPVGPVDWIDDGVLTALPTSRHTATLTGLPWRPGVDNLVLEVSGGAGSIDDLVASTERGLLLTCLWYIREVDPQELLLTGLTRDGTYLVEGGEVVAAVNNFRFNESPVSLLGRFTEAGQTARSWSREWGDFFPRTAMPALRVPDFNMSSVSPAS